MSSNNKESQKFNPNEIPYESSLGHLAYGDLAFKAWRELKTKNRKEDNEEE